MADSQFFTDLARLDRTVANAWKKVTGDKPKAILDSAGVESIMMPLVDAGKITQDQGKALGYLLDNAKFEKEALEEFRIYIYVASERDFFTLGAGRQVLKPDEIKDVASALGMGNVGKIGFTSPKTGVTYTPNHYQVIREMLTTSMIFVVEVNSGGLHKKTRMVEASYHSDLNRLMVFADLPPIHRMAHIVHETTHAVQDWLDIDSEVKFVEADAWIAGGVAALAGGGDAALKSYLAAAAWTTVAAASTIVFKGDLKDFSKAYEAVWKEMEPALPNKRFRPSAKEKGANEKAQFDALMAKITAKKPGP